MTYCPPWPVTIRWAGSTPTRRRHQLAASLRATRTGRVTAMKARMGSASRMADRSGWAIAHDFGAISPMTRCRKVMTTSARMNPAMSASTYGAPSHSIAGVSQWWSAGLTPPRRGAGGDAELGAGEEDGQPVEHGSAARRTSGGGRLLEPVAAGAEQRTRRRRRTRSTRWHHRSGEYDRVTHWSTRPQPPAPAGRPISLSRPCRSLDGTGVPPRESRSAGLGRSSS